MMHVLSVSRASIAAILVISSAFADAPHKTPAPDVSATARHAPQLAEGGHCDQAIALLTKSVAHLPNGDLEKTVGLVRLKCAILLNQMDAAADFVRMLE